MTDNLTMRLIDPLAHQRCSSRTADKYITREGAAAEGTTAEVKDRMGDERDMLEAAFEHVRRGLGANALGKAARLQLNKIEAVMIRDYGLYGRIKTNVRG